ncbi:bifunctional [glutamate--ammonia ligase]-adenylyl-L-tyrosine phosphorylase/[glutamate--ammonia-ligase] adenylyltransferase [Hydrogenovibrio halophilus]|uniref:bifunctional [glutamate--ammonia ligase]-adenylyl-L-tyrosine phosphorylase/[glutamate--ammonia-ligase] adenylyltransferase n=1 Tax=Hydrogenovibrio halophilus TaxID=373391 RepID=UPI00035E1C2D|nr:bifunctional [glutamate--ammonia ligase]-adenylyl-L-tyrosine phosphorylase/[glutamate--ammonia-ligase] adenylyltransferase [Hydrogenovibrio halophilus]
MSDAIRFPLTDVDQLQRWSRFLVNEGRRAPHALDASLWETPYEDGAMIAKIQTDLAQSDSLATLNKKLRQYRREEMMRIALRDLSGLADLPESMRDLSDLADALVGGALDWHTQALTERHGTPIGEHSGEPQKLLIIGMGKLGGQELNFSSDIDLIFVYPEKGQTEGGKRPLANDQFFTRLGQALNKSLTEFTPDGTVYRVDMRLRPFGQSGPLAVSFAEMENYYQVHGRAWERYALVKGRIMAGDVEQGKELFDILRPFVYRKYVDFTAIESLRELKQMINVEVQKKDRFHNIKLGPGGIREIEFIVQAFQLVHGGREPALQGRALLPTLQTLVERQFIEADTAEDLKAAYVFLRRAENRLQIWNDQQTHDLPGDPEPRQALAESMGYADYAEFHEALEAKRDFVQQEFDAVFAQKEEDAREEDGFDQACMNGQVDPASLEALNLPDAEKLSRLLNHFYTQRPYTHASSEALNRFDGVMPLLLRQLAHTEQPALALERVLRVLTTIMGRSVYLVLLKENQQAVKHLLQLCELSSWTTDMLVKYPSLLDQLLDERILYEPLLADALLAEAVEIRERHQGDDEVFMNELRQWKHAQVFRVAAADITGHLPIMKVSDYLTWIAEAVVKVATDYAWYFMQGRSGLPGGCDSPDACPLTVIGYGKLGGIELGYGSDLDIVFVYDADSSLKSQGDKPLENHVYFMRLAQKIISILTTFMPTGTLYEVDTRLRPNGESGMIVTDMAAFEAYQQNKAWTWEHQALVRTRAMAGDASVMARFADFRKQILARERDKPELKQAVVEMRDKMRRSLDKTNAEVFDLKQGRGGIVDIEFMVQYFVLGYAGEIAELLQWSDNIRLLEAIAQQQLLPESESQALIDAYRHYRARYHRLALQNKKARVPADEYADDREAVAAIWDRVMTEQCDLKGGCV